MRHSRSPRRALRQTARASATVLAVEHYLEAWRWRREVERRLKSVDLTFTQWFVLDATHRRIRQTKGAVNQNDVARETELDRMTVSQVMKTLVERGHVDRDTDETGRGYRMWLTSQGEKTLALAEKSITASNRA